ncbi:MAG TPA: carbohydrate porin [Nitrospirota bacterium]|nr:carbohydrate porin [Nitrospirota bacterium]
MVLIAIISLCKKLLKKSAFISASVLLVGVANAETPSEPGWAPQLLGMQATIIYQNMPAFSSPYEGPQSLTFKNGEGHGHTETYGIYLGSQILPRLQAYLDVEQARGNGIGHAVGLGGITNGDVIRQGSTDLGQNPYIARLFLRYLIPLSRETASVERAMDQLPGEEPLSRIEIKGGLMAATDDFDQNRYANNTRIQFLNWGFINNTAWDFAANTRGYSYGLLVSYIRPSWKLAYGIYKMPTTANGNEFDHIGTSSGNNLELTLRPNQEGTVMRFLAYYNTGRMGNYEEAISTGQATGMEPDIAKDNRPGRHKYGFGFNVEQPLADAGETGAFARIGWNDGHTEDFAFTEVDRHLSTGMQVSGVHWGRTEDRLGVAYVWHGLSPEHREYLAAGGTGFLLGDGKLNYGLEQIFETYYRVQLGQYAQLSPDFQYIQNPGYNRDRGPVEVYSVRLRLSY